jgi:Pyridine nucleotide-disulphide oxidoreductase
MPDFDAIIIGTGQTGPSLAFRLAGAGMKVAVVERHLVGGTCVNTGCTPTKALVASAYAARIARRAAEYGVAIEGDIGIDMRRVKARKDAIVAASRNGLTSALENATNITLYRGHARFAAPHAVAIAGEWLNAQRIFINAGVRALVPPMPGINDVPYLTNSSMMDVDFLPHHGTPPPHRYTAPRQKKLDEGEASLQQAIRIAQAQQAKIAGIARRPRSRPAVGEQGRRTEARDLISPVYGWFTEGFDTADLKEAKALLDQLE